MSALDDLKKLRGVKYTWKNSNIDDIGVIAQEVELVYSELVHEIDGIKRVNYNGLIAVLIEAVKELSEKLEGHCGCGVSPDKKE